MLGLWAGEKTNLLFINNLPDLLKHSGISNDSKIKPLVRYLPEGHARTDP